MSRYPKRISSPFKSSPGHRSPLTALGVAIIVTLLVLTSQGVPVSAQSGWQVVSQESNANFSESIDAALNVRHNQAIVDVVLFYGREGDRLVRRVYPPFSPGPILSVDFSEPLEAGQFAPGTSLRLWWRLTDIAGNSFDTPVQTILYQDTKHDWRSLAGENITLYYYDQRESRAAGWRDDAERSLSRIQSETGLTIEAPLYIYVYRSEADMRSALTTRSDDYDARVTTLGVAVDEDTLILLGSQPDLELTMAHELSHLVVGLATDNPYAGLPRWLDEGLAMLAEGDLPRQNAIALQRGIAEDALLSVRSMTSYSGRAEQVDLYYGECHSVVSFLIDTYGRERMTEFLLAFSKGTSQHEALSQVYGITIEELDALWRESLGLEPREPIPSSRIPALASRQPC